MHAFYQNGRIIVDPALKKSGNDSFMDSNGIIHLNPDLFQETTFEQFIKTRDNVSSLNIPQLEDLYKSFTTRTNFRRRVQIAGALIESKFAGSQTVRNQFYKKLYNHYSSQNPRNWRLPIINELMQGSRKQSNRMSKTMKSPVNKPVIAPSQKPSPGKTTKDYIYHNNMPITKNSWKSMVRKHGKHNVNWVLDLFSRKLNNNPIFTKYNGKLPEELLYPKGYDGRSIGDVLRKFAKSCKNKNNQSKICDKYSQVAYESGELEAYMEKNGYVIVHKEVRGDDNLFADASFGHYYLVIGIVDMKTLKQTQDFKNLLEEKNLKSVEQLDSKDVLNTAIKNNCFTWAETGENDIMRINIPAHRRIEDYYHESGWFYMKNGKKPGWGNFRVLRDPEKELLD